MAVDVSLPHVTTTRIGLLRWYAEMPWGTGTLSLTARTRRQARQRALRMYVASPEGMFGAWHSSIGDTVVRCEPPDQCPPAAPA